MPTVVHQKAPFNIYFEPLQHATAQMSSFRWQSISQLARPCILSPCPITYYLLLTLALRLFLKPAQLPGLSRTLIPVSSPRAGSSLLSQQKQFREGSEKCQSRQGMQLKEGEGRSKVPSLFLPANY